MQPMLHALCVEQALFAAPAASLYPYAVARRRAFQWLRFLCFARMTGEIFPRAARRYEEAGSREIRQDFSETDPSGITRPFRGAGSPRGWIYLRSAYRRRTGSLHRASQFQDRYMEHRQTAVVPSRGPALLETAPILRAPRKVGANSGIVRKPFRWQLFLHIVATCVAGHTKIRSHHDGVERSAKRHRPPR